MAVNMYSYYYWYKKIYETREFSMPKNEMTNYMLVASDKALIVTKC